MQTPGNQNIQAVLSGLQRAASTPPQLDRRPTGSVSGVIVDNNGSVLVGVAVSIKRDDKALSPDVVTGDNGDFTFTNIETGPFQVAVSAPGFTAGSASGTVHPGETVTVPQIVLTIAAQSDKITVTAGFQPVEVAEFQVQDEEKQRVLGIIPNFYVSYDSNPEPLNTRQKFSLAWKSSIDPFTFAGSAALAGIEQAADELNGYGQGLKGYARRYGAAYGDVTIGTYIGSAILPSLLHQDPRFFYKSTGSKKARFFYALASPFIAKGDNGKWQPNYSYVIGTFAGAGISTLYYPPQDRAFFQVAGVRLGENALSAIFQEFIFKKLTHLQPSQN